VPKLFAWAESVPWLAKYLDQADVPLAVSDELPAQNHVVVCGYGRIGRNIVRLLQDRNYPVLVIDQSESRIQQVREAGLPYIYGNAVSLHVLEKAGVAHAKGMAIALPDPMSTRLCLKRSLELAPELDVVVRANKDKDIELLYQLGAKEVVQPQFEASLELSAHLLKGGGLTASAVQREVQQIRNSHYFELRPDRPSAEISRDLKAATKEMNSRWYTLPKLSPLLGMTLDETDMRRLTGVSLVAIRRAGGAEIDYPDGQMTLEQGDRLLIVGDADEVAAFDELAKGEAAVPGSNSSCQWLEVPLESSIAGKTLADLFNQYSVRVQAVRREGRFLRFPDTEVDIQPGDRLLLCGGFHSLMQASQTIAPKQSSDLQAPVSSLSINGVPEYAMADDQGEP
jgi:CPA2 family monovalent cation:H+ antiporter-2